MEISQIAKYFENIFYYFCQKNFFYNCGFVEVRGKFYKNFNKFD